jgi:NADPH-dependent ferric siderophore reductase
VERQPVRLIEVVAITRVTPHMARVTFGGPDLTDFTSGEPDQQVKLYFPKPGQAVPRLPDADNDFMSWYQAFNDIPEEERPWTRGYTIRAHHPADVTIDIDFVLHDHAGPATRWAESARPGDKLAMFGPSAMFARAIPLSKSIADTDWLLLAGDATALPAISAMIEQLPRGARAIAYIEVADAAEEQHVYSQGAVTLHWLHRGDTPPGYGILLQDAVRAADFPPGAPFAWLAGEASAIRDLRRHLIHERGLDKRAIDFTGHWRLRLSQDDAPTEEDMAEAQERLATAY